MKKRLYLKVKNYNGYDEWYMPVSKRDKTWESILNDIESVLDNKFLENNDEIEGIRLDVEFVMEDPSIIETEDDE